MKDNKMIYIILGGAFLISAAVAHFIYKDTPDNPAEQIEEEIIKNVTGAEIDLSPEQN